MRHLIRRNFVLTLPPQTSCGLPPLGRGGKSGAVGMAELHLHYENRKPPKTVKVEMNRENYQVDKMCFPDKKDKTVIEYNKDITIKNIPLEAYEYVVNGRSAIEWIMERYQIKTDKDSGITNDPNDWAKEHGQPRYILDLLLSIITVSLETMKIVKALLKVKFE